MEQTIFTAGGLRARQYTCNTVVVGTGAAGYNTADRLWMQGQRDVAIVTEAVNAGTSRNTGSDKQTYYKLTLAGDEPDSVLDMAKTLFSGQCVDGDHALCEAALSAQGFLRLAELGVPFPQNRYGEFVGYKTDHDPKRRATSVGPYTSKKMTEALQASVEAKGIPVLDHLLAIRILSDGERVFGLVCLDTVHAADAEQRFVVLLCKNLVWATGGPAGMYRASIFPESQSGTTGIALEAGAAGKNLTEWQYGLGTLRPRWNVSGSYMQVLPRFYSVGEDGAEREFLADWFQNPAKQLSCQFFKGYQWPFDVRKAMDGSAVIDLLVYQELSQGRRVYLDYTKNPLGGNFKFEDLDPEAYTYLSKAGACFGTPFERLAHMNQPAVDFFRDHQVDLAAEPVEIAVCAQHNNGGLAVDAWWQTRVEGLFAVGEAAATHGVYRPGGSALNAGQVGSTRAARYIAVRRTGTPEACPELMERALAELNDLAETAVARGGDGADRLWDTAQAQMTLVGASIRDSDAIRKYKARVDDWLEHFGEEAGISNPARLPRLFRLRDMLLAQSAYLTAMEDYATQGGKSRGSALYTDPAGDKPFAGLPDRFRFVLDDGSRGHLVQELRRQDGDWTVRWREVRPIPEEDDFFENVWRAYREDGNVR